MSAEIAAFLRARYAEQRQAEMSKRRARDGTPSYTMTRGMGDGYVQLSHDGRPYGPRLSIDEFHERYTDPAPDPFVIADLDAKEQLLDALEAERHSALTPGGSTEIYCPAGYDNGEPCDCGRDERVNRYLRLLATPFADHPDYRETWRP